jgi:hypothetical protein
VAGLGSAPGDVTINGTIDVYNRCLPPTPPDTSNCTALDNFWRSMSNLTINVTGQTGCQSGTDFWAVSQAAPMRRVNVTGGNLSLMDYCSAGPQYASGGFIAGVLRRHGHQWLATAVHRAQQQPRRLVQRGVEPGVRGRHRRPGTEFLLEFRPRWRNRSLHDPRHHPGHQGRAIPAG